MRLQTSTWLTVLVLAAAGCDTAAPAAGAPAISTLAPSTPVSRVAPTLSDLAAEQGGRAVAVDERGVPRFIVATAKGPSSPELNGTAERAARYHLGRFLAAQAVDSSALAIARTVGVRELAEGGRLVHLRQQVDQLDVYPGDVKVLLNGDNTLVAISGALVAPNVDRSGFAVSAAAAVARAVSDRTGFAVAGVAVRTVGQQGTWELVRVDGEGLAALSEPAHVRPVYYPKDGALRPAYVLEFLAPAQYGAELELFRAVVSATDAQIWERAELTAYDAFSYRVWADATDKRPLDGPTADFTPHPTGVPDRVRPPFIAPNLVSVDGLNKNPLGQPDPWLPKGSVETTGNNVDAYSDTVLPDGYSNGDVRATTTAAGVFDRTYDVNAAPTDGGAIAQGQLMAGIAEAFYVTNWLHDYWYDHGFDERAGNNQLDNYGRGGIGGDPMHIEVQDLVFGSPPKRNNANMNTPADGFSPRMQIYVWTGYSSRELKTSLSATSLATGVAAFGPTNFSLTGDLVLMDDGVSTATGGVGTTTDGCTAPMNMIAGKIVLVDRGNCSFKVKALVAQTAGAIGMIVANNAVGTSPPALGDDPATMATITIGTLSVTLADGNALKAGLPAGPVTVTAFSRFTAPDADGSLDNAVVAHEYGHFLHHRLQDCTSNAQCRGMSEGWGDFVAMHLILRDGDNLDGTFSASTYAGMGTSADGAFFGIRRYPYTTDMTKSPLTFKYVADQMTPLPAGIPTNPASPTLSEVHNAGEIWASTLFDAYVALQKARAATETFETVRTRFARDLTTALQLAPRDSTYTEMRDAILAVISARSATDRDLVAQAFARRGLGTCAVSPPRYATEGMVTGVTEATTLSPSLALGAITLDDATTSCDRDGVLDAEERGMLTLAISNASPLPATGTTLDVTSMTAGVTLPNGGTVNVPSIAPYQTVQVPVAVALAPSVTLPTTATFDVAVNNMASCAPMLSTQLVTRLNVDEQLAASADDDVEAAKTVWTPVGLGATDVWAREVKTAPNHIWHGADLGQLTDTSLETPALQVSATQSFVVTFSHAFSFEYSTIDGGSAGWDGAVIELSDNGGPWVDVTTLGVTPGYNGTLYNIVNPLGTTRQVYLHRNPSYPMPDTVTLDFGTQLAGKSVKLRFRIGTDAAAGDTGWELDDLHFAGITNTPFASVVADTHVCNRPPVAVAGADRTVTHGAPVFLDASGSTDPDSDPLTYTWAQTAGPTVSLQTTSGRVSGFTAPAATAMDQVLTFTVTVSDGTLTATDAVDVTVSANRAPVANAGPARTVGSGSVVVLDGSGSADPDADALAWTWTQTAGPTVTLSSTSTPIVTFTAPIVTTDTPLTFSLGVADGLADATAMVTVTVTANRTPVAVASGTSTMISLGTGLLDAAESNDPEGDAISFTWTQTAGPAATIASPSRATTAFTAPAVDADTTLTFAVEVSDGHTSATATVDVMVRANLAPGANAGLDSTVFGGDPVILKGTGTDPEGKPVTFLWTQTSGTPTVMLADARSPVTSFIAPLVTETAQLEFQLTATDDSSHSTTDALVITVNPATKSGCGCSAGGGPLGLLLLAALGLRRRRASKV